MSRKLLIFAYDFSSYEPKHRELLEEIGPYIDLVKVGLEAMTAEVGESHRTVASLVREFTIDVLNKDVMWDMKLLDVKNTMEKAAANIVHFGSKFYTLHAQASDASLAAVAQVGKERSPLPLAVTALTDLDDSACVSRFDCTSAEAVVRFADIAQENGIRGIVCSAKETRPIREGVFGGNGLTLITPGIRPVWAVTPDEQKRVTTPKQAVENGADGIVVGRPIAQPPQGMSQLEAVKRIREELDAAA